MKGPLLLLLFAPIAFAGTSAKLRVNQNGINYVAGIARDILEKEIRAAHIPDMTFNTGGMRIKVMRIALFSVNLPRINVKIEDNKIILTTSGGSFSGRMRVQAIYRCLIAKCTTSGDAELKFWDLNSQITLRWQKNSSTPQLEIASCNGYLRKADVTLHGNILVNIIGWFSDYIAKVFVEQFSKKTCPLAQSGIDRLNKILLDMPDLYPVTKEGKRIFSIQTENLKTTVGPNFLDVTGNAAFLFKNKKCTAVIQQEFPETPVTHMASAWGSQGIPDCLLHAFHESDQLQYLITSKTAQIGPFLRTSCPSDNPAIPKCMGDLFPKLAQTYPNKSVEILAYTTAPPNVTIEKEGVKIIGFTALNVTLDSKVLAQFKLNLTTIFDPILLPERLNGTIRIQNTSLRLASSTIGEISQIYLYFIGKFVTANANFILKPIADKGIPIPTYMGIKLDDSSSISMYDGYMKADIDFHNQ